MSIGKLLNDKHYLKKYGWLLIISILLFIISIILFNGYLQEGMDNDEVLRIIPVIQYFNRHATPINQSIFSIHLFGHVIPIMFKEYISSLYPFLYTPIVLFNNYFIGVRVMHLFYFIASILVFFIVFFKANRFIGLWSSLIIVTSPLLYPELREGFVHTWHFIAVALSFYFFKIFFNDNRKCIYLFLAIFILSLMTNIVFYFSWIFAAFILASLLLFSDYWLIIIKSVKYVIVSILAVFLGLFNYVIYNIMNGYPTFMKLYLSIFNTSKYNKNPIDYHRLGSISEEIKIKILSLSHNFDGYYTIYFFVLILLILLSSFVFYVLIKKGKFKENRVYFLPFLIFLFTLFFILISPKAQRAGHFVFLFPAYQLAIVSMLYVLKEKILHQKLVKYIIYISLSSFVLFNFYVSYDKISKINITGGTGLHTTAIYKLEGYIKTKKLNINKFVFLQWGMVSQLYLFNKGEMKPDSLIFALFDKSKEEQDKIFLYYLLKKNNITGKNYFPLFFKVNEAKIDNVKDNFLDFVTSHGGHLKIEKIFYEKNMKDKAIELYTIENIKQFRKKILNKLEHKLKTSNKIKIIRYGINKSGTMWIIAEGLTKNIIVVINNKFYSDIFKKTYLTTTLQQNILNNMDKNWQLKLCDTDKNICSPSISLKYKENK